jgi:hypothetical protein
VTLRTSPPAPVAAASAPERVENRSALPQGEALTEAQAKRLTQWLPSRQNMIKRCWQGQAGRKLAIHMQCLDCCGEDVEAVRTCCAPCCPLWHFRPFQQHNVKRAEHSTDLMGITAVIRGNCSDSVL